MSLFSYNASTANGERTAGIVDATTLQAACNALRSMNLFVAEIHEATQREREGIRPWEIAAVNDRCQGSGVRDQEQRAIDQKTDAIPQKDDGDNISNLTPETYNLKPAYYPLLDTLRLYAGWLLAWYILVVALGAYQELKGLPFRIPLVEDLWQSILVIRAAFAVFLFLTVTSLYRFSGNRLQVGGGTGIIGVLLFIVFIANT